MKTVHGRRVGWACEDCGRSHSQGWLLEFHHILPRNAGGRDTFENMRLLCVEDHYYAHVALRRQGLDHPQSANLVYARLLKTQGRTKWWHKEHAYTSNQMKLI